MRVSDQFGPRHNADAWLLGSVGTGNLRLMSYLTPERVPVGYSLTRQHQH
jgi:hypothetical protein